MTSGVAAPSNTAMGSFAAKVARLCFKQGRLPRTGDMWRLLREPGALEPALAAYANQFRNQAITHVVCPETRGSFDLASRLAFLLEAGVVPVRTGKTPGKVIWARLAGDDVATSATPVDAQTLVGPHLKLAFGALTQASRVLVVDFVTADASAIAVQVLVKQQHATVVATLSIVGVQQYCDRTGRLDAPATIRTEPDTAMSQRCETLLADTLSSAPAAPRVEYHQDAGLQQMLRDNIASWPNFPNRGVVFFDVLPVLRDGAAFRAVVQAFVSRYQHVKVDAIAYAEARGILIGAAVAQELTRLGRPCIAVPICKRGSTADDVNYVEFLKEYGPPDSSELSSDLFLREMNCVVMDDLIGTGQTIRAAVRLIEAAGGQCIEAAAMVIVTDFTTSISVPVFGLIGLSEG